MIGENLDTLPYFDPNEHDDEDRVRHVLTTVPPVLQIGVLVEENVPNGVGEIPPSVQCVTTTGQEMEIPLDPTRIVALPSKPHDEGVACNLHKAYDFLAVKIAGVIEGDPHLWLVICPKTLIGWVVTSRRQFAIAPI